MWAGEPIEKANPSGGLGFVLADEPRRAFTVETQFYGTNPNLTGSGI